MDSYEAAADAYLAGAVLFAEQALLRASSPLGTLARSHECTTYVVCELVHICFPNFCLCGLLGGRQSFLYRISMLAARALL